MNRFDELARSVPVFTTGERIEGCEAPGQNRYLVEVHNGTYPYERIAFLEHEDVARELAIDAWCWHSFISFGLEVKVVDTVTWEEWKVPKQHFFGPRPPTGKTLLDHPLGAGMGAFERARVLEAEAFMENFQAQLGKKVWS